AELEHGAIAPIEQEIARLAGVRSLRSTIEPGRALVVISLDASRPIELAAAEVRRAIQELRPRLPEDLELPVISLADPAGPALWFELAGAGALSRGERSDLAREVIEPRLTR